MPPTFEPLGPEDRKHCSSNCVNDASWYANWFDSIIVPVCENHKRKVASMSWEEARPLLAASSPPRRMSICR